MEERDINQAIAHVRQMQALVLDRQGFRGFSGAARMAGGAAALLAALILRHAVPPEPSLHLVGWGVLLVAGLAVNFAALFYWLVKNRKSFRLAELWPVFSACCGPGSPSPTRVPWDSSSAWANCSAAGCW